jgi:hypothetical protein
MKLRIIKINLDQFNALLKGNALSFSADFPEDIEVLDSTVDLFSRQVSFIVRSDSFPDIKETFPIPELTPKATLETNGTIPMQASPTHKIEPKSKPTPAETKPLTTNVAQPPISRYATKMENEFSPDQRKLLNFTVKDDCVIVKPVTFLKAEWEDINDVVRSLGGKWVKGDIISYWEIPLQ